MKPETRLLFQTSFEMNVTIRFETYKNVQKCTEPLKPNTLC